MARRGQTGQHLRKSGLYAGGNWPEYRYGTPKPAVYRPIHKGQKRQLLVDRAMDVLRNWRESPFEQEATCRTALRSALCIEGHGWQQSDMEADSIVQEGLHLLGARRPSYAEGQWEYSVSPDYCARCQSPLDDETRSRGSRFCSAVCAKSAYEHRVYSEVRTHYAMAQNAYVMIRTDAAPAVQCSHCRKSFKRMNIEHDLKAHNRVYCSKACHDASMVVYADRDCHICGKTFRPKNETHFLCSKVCMGKAQVKGPNRECQHCGTAFRSYRVGNPEKGRYCSRECVMAARSSNEIHKTCEWCTADFVAKGAKAMYCSTRCREQSNRFASGKWRPTKITPPVFDAAFTKPINRHARDLTPERFDRLVEA